RFAAARSACAPIPTSRPSCARTCRTTRPPADRARAVGSTLRGAVRLFARLDPGIDERVDELVQLAADHLVGTFEQQRVLEGVLRHLPQLGQVLVEDLDLLHARDDAAVGTAPRRGR